MRRVALVKSAGRADEFVGALQGRGLTPVLVSPFRRESIPGGEAALSGALTAGPDWLAVTSSHAVPALAMARDLIGGTRVAAVGSGTATALHAIGVAAEIVGDAGGASLAARMVARGVGGESVVLHPCGADARPDLRDALQAAGAAVIVAPVYRMIPDPIGERAAAGTFVAVIVTSPRLAVRAAELFLDRPPVVAIGRATASALRDLGWTPRAVAARPSPDEVADAVAGALR